MSVNDRLRCWLRWARVSWCFAGPEYRFLWLGLLQITWRRERHPVWGREIRLEWDPD